MIEISNLTKIYKLSKKQMKEKKTKATTKIAANDISLVANKGEIFGLLGPNGAGKTTTLRCIATLLKPTSGSVKVNGYDTVKEGEKVRGGIGFLTNEIKLDPNFSPKYLFEFFSNLHGVSKETMEQRRTDLFTYFGIHNFQDKKISELSTGMKQKASIAISLVHDPDIVIFDEPTSGLDVITAKSVVDYLSILKERGKLVIVSTHIMSEAERLCDRLAVIIDGKKVAEGTIQSLLEESHTDDLEEAFFELYKNNHVEEEVK